MLGDFASGLSSLKAIKDIVQGLNAANTQAKINDVKIELQGHVIDAQGTLLTAQEEYSAATKRIGELEQEIVKLKDWEGEKKRYQLSSIGLTAVAYTLKKGMENGEPPHWLCQPCFESGHKHALQFVEVTPTAGGRGMKSVWKCGSCGNQIKAGMSAVLSDPSTW